MTASWPPRLTGSLYAASMVLLAGAFFAPLGDLGLDTHDGEMFRDHQAISHNFSFFFSDAREQATGRPLAELVKWLAFVAWGPDARSFHFLAIALHTIASLLLAWVLCRLGQCIPVGLATGLLFLVNVAHFEAIHHISGLDYPLAAIWTWLAIWCYGRNCLWGYTGLLAAGVLTHMATVMLLPFCAYWSWSKGEQSTAIVRRLIPPTALTLALLVLATGLTPSDTSTSKAFTTLLSVHWYDTATDIIHTLLYFLGQLAGLAHWLPISPYLNPIWLRGLGLALFALALWLIVKRTYPLHLAAAWLLLALFPFLLIPLDLGGSRYLYLASAGSSLLLSTATYHLCRRWDRPGSYLHMALLAALVGSSYLGLRATEAISLFKTGRYAIFRQDLATGTRLLQQAIDHNSDILPLGPVYFQLAMAHITHHQAHEAIVIEGLERVPDDPQLQALALATDLMADDKNPVDLLNAKQPDRTARFDSTLAEVLHLLGYRASLNRNYDRAIKAHTHGLGSRFLRDRNRESLIRVLMSSGRANASAEQALAGIDESPDNPYFPRAALLALLKTGQTARAVAVCRTALSIHPTEILATHCAEALKIEGTLTEADRSQMERLLSDSVFSSESYTRMGLAFDHLGERALSLLAYRQALDIDTENWAARTNLGWLHYQAGNFQQAIEVYRPGLSAGESVLLFNLGLAYLAAGDSLQAGRVYARAITRFGVDEGRRIGAVDDLRQLTSHGPHAPVARQILNTYWNTTGEPADHVE